MSTADQLAEAVRKAANDGDIIAPSQLIAHIAGLENPIQAITDWDQANQLFASFDAEFGFIRFAHQTKQPIQRADMGRYAALLRWLIRELRRWRRVDDDHSKALVAIVVVAQICDFDNHLWQSLPDGIGANADLIDCFKDCVANFTVAINPAPRARPWDVEAIEKFHEADSSGDWVGIINGWTQLRDLPFFIANTLQTEAARFLYHYALNVLVQAVTNLVRIAPAMQIAGAFSVEKRLRIAILANSPHFEFAAAYKTVTERRNPPRPFGRSHRIRATPLIGSLD